MALFSILLPSHNYGRFVSEAIESVLAQSWSDFELIILDDASTDDSWSIIEQFPVTGVGLNNFAETFKRHDTTGYSRIFRGYRHVVHNLHLWIWTETGTVGLLAFLAPFVVTIWVALRHAPRAPPVPRAIMVGIAAGLFAHLMHGMVDPGFRVSLTVSFLIFTSMGVVGALALRHPVPPST